MGSSPTPSATNKSSSVGAGTLHYFPTRGWVKARGGEKIGRPDTLVLRFLKTKTEQCGGEHLRSHSLSGEDRCVVTSVTP